MIKCLECGKEYSDQAARCVHCGARNPNKKRVGVQLAVLAAVVVIGVIVLVAVVGGGGNKASELAATQTQICAQSAEAAHYIAAMSLNTNDVVRVTDQVIANRKYPLLGDKVLANVGAIVALKHDTETPDEIAADIRNTPGCRNLTN